MDLDPTSTEQTLGLFIYDFFFHKEDSKGANPSTLKIPVRANDLAQQPNSKKIRTGMPQTIVLVILVLVVLLLMLRHMVRMDMGAVLLGKQGGTEWLALPLPSWR